MEALLLAGFRGLDIWWEHNHQTSLQLGQASRFFITRCNAVLLYHASPQAPSHGSYLTGGTALPLFVGFKHT
eukprot:2308154-Amphidinium_carterae.2